MKRWAVLLLLGSWACGDGPTRLHGRVVSLRALAGAEAREEGCGSMGAQAGGGFVALSEAAGGLDRYFGAEGPSWVILLEGFGLAEDGRPGPFELRWLDGVALGGDRFQIDYDSYFGGDPSEGARQGFGPVELEAGGWVGGQADRLTLPPLGPVGPLTLEEVGIEAQLLVARTGLTVRRGVLAGYLPATALPPGPWSLDAQASPEGFQRCEAGDRCDALSVCMSVDVDPLPPEQME